MMKVDMTGKTVLITGSKSGIGKGMARIFAQNGANLVLNGVHPEHGEEVLEEIRALGAKAIFVRADVSKPEEAKRLVDAAVSEFGGISVLINNAGINIAVKDRGPIHEFPDEKWRQILDVDLNGVYYCSKAALKHMIPAGGGKIINISSITGVTPLRNQCGFAAAKAAVVHLTKTMAIELAEYHVNVNVVCPGSIQIPIMYEGGMYKDGRYESIMSHIPQHRPGSPDDIGYACLYLASEEADYVTGAVHIVDGGWTAGFARDW